eukprot:2574183-Heterocapsa_arctica.AAC.1
MLDAADLASLRSQAAWRWMPMSLGEVSRSWRDVPLSSIKVKGSGMVHPNLVRESHMAPKGPLTWDQDL